jgi:hypothetical protein
MSMKPLSKSTSSLAAVAVAVALAFTAVRCRRDVELGNDPYPTDADAIEATSDGCDAGACDDGPRPL